MYMYVTFCSSVNSVYFTFHCLHCVTIVNMVINIVVCFIPNKLLYFVLVKGHCFVCLFKPLDLPSQMMQVVTINERSMRSKAIRFFF